MTIYVKAESKNLFNPKFLVHPIISGKQKDAMEQLSKLKKVVRSPCNLQLKAGYHLLNHLFHYQPTVFMLIATALLIAVEGRNAPKN